MAVVPLGLRHYCAVTTITMVMTRFYCSSRSFPTAESMLMITGSRSCRRTFSKTENLPSTTSFTLRSSPSTSTWLTPLPLLHRLCQRKRFRGHHSYSTFQRTYSLHLNRILFDISEIDNVLLPTTPPLVSSSGVDDSGDKLISDRNDTKDELDDLAAALATVTLPRDDYRTIHVAKILGLCNGDTVRAGVVRPAEHDDNNMKCYNLTNAEGSDHQYLAGLITDDAIISWLPEGKNKKAQPTKNGEPPGSLRVSIPQPPKSILYDNNHRNNENDDDETTTTSSSSSMTAATAATTETARTSTTRRCPVSLLLALPRPLQLGRLLPMITQLGIHHLILTSARKVPKDYFGSHVLRKPSVLRNLLIEGLAQSGDVQLPKITIVKQSLKVFMEEELETLFPVKDVARVVAHPTRIRRRSEVDDAVQHDVVSTTCAMRMADIRFPNDVRRQLLVAVG